MNENNRINVKKLEAMIAAYEIVLAQLIAQAGDETANRIRRMIPEIPVGCTQDTIERILIAAELVDPRG